jgi:hypothetical protein
MARASKVRRTPLGCLPAALALLLSPSPPATAAAPGDRVLVGAGDIAVCGTTADTRTGDRVEAVLAADPAAIAFTLGDNAYGSGSRREFSECYHPTWGSFRSRTRPAVGNHEYKTTDAAGYFDYFGSTAGDPAKGWYSYDIGAWHVVVLNSNCSEIGGCGASSPQGRWLRANLANHPDDHVLAYWHHPRYTSGVHGNAASMQAFWEILYRAGAELVLSGHDHDYERFAPQDPWGRRDDDHGIRQFVVGTGGVALRGLRARAPHSEVFASSHGVLRLTLGVDSYEWAFLPIPGGPFTDSGTGRTHGRPPSWTSRTFTATSDAWVGEGQPTVNHGTSTRLYVDGDTGAGLDRDAYVKARVSGLRGTVDRAALRLWITNPTADGPTVSPTTTSWSGRTITWADRPGPTGSTVVDAGTVQAGAFHDFDVTSAIDGDGTYGFVLRPTSRDGLAASSLQGAHPPRLIVQTIP